MGPSESDFSFAITRIAVAQVCQSVGYGAAQNSTLDTLSDVATRYLKAIAKSAGDSANSSGRTQFNLFDIVIALEDLGSVQGFPGASSSKMRSSLVSSSLLKEIIKFVLCSDEIPFAQPLPRKILSTSTRSGYHLDEIGSYCHGVNLGHVPKWLPDMPVIGGKEVEAGKGEKENLRCDFHGEKKTVEAEGKGKEEKRNGKGFELPEKRPMVKFEMGVKGRLGVVEIGGRVLGRGGIGKRVLCHNLVLARDLVGVDGERRKKKAALRPRG